MKRKIIYRNGFVVILYLTLMFLFSQIAGCTTTELQGFKRGKVIRKETEIVDEKKYYRIELNTSNWGEYGKLRINLAESIKSEIRERSIYEKIEKLKVIEKELSVLSLIRWPLYPVQFVSGISGSAYFYVTLVPRTALSFATYVVAIVYIPSLMVAALPASIFYGAKDSKLHIACLNMWPSVWFVDVTGLSNLLNNDENNLVEVELTDWPSTLYKNLWKNSSEFGNACFLFAFDFPENPIQSKEAVYLERKVEGEEIAGDWQTRIASSEELVPGQEFKIKGDSFKEITCKASSNGYVSIDLIDLVEGLHHDQFLKLTVIADTEIGLRSKRESIAVSDIRIAYPTQIEWEPASGSTVEQPTILLRIKIKSDNTLKRVVIDLNSQIVKTFTDRQNELGYALDEKIKVSLKEGINRIKVKVYGASRSFTEKEFSLNLKD